MTGLGKHARLICFVGLEGFGKMGFKEGQGLMGVISAGAGIWGGLDRLWDGLKLGNILGQMHRSFWYWVGLMRTLSLTFLDGLLVNRVIDRSG